MRAGSLVVLALCLYAGAGVRATDDLRTMLGGSGLPTGGKLSALKDSMMAAAAPISAGLGQIHSALKAQYETVTGQLETVVAAAEAEYCTPATFVPGSKEPATFTGSSMTVTFALGNCSFNEAAYVEEGRKVLNCTEPSISYEKVPSMFTSKYNTAPTFTSKECIVTKVFGEPEEKVLFNFDGSQAPDMNSLIAKITEEVKGVMGSVGSGAADMFNAAKGSLAGGAFGR